MGGSGAVVADCAEARPADGVDTTRSDPCDPVAYATGTPWRDIPERYGPWESAYSLFRRWQRDGTWARALEQCCRPARTRRG
ncbi:transposase [Streptomyces sp. NPDC051079]|uniref:transposase n=1 Tax=Streptomyces sp. NPDC051079 TaxID=3155043 RepID=UPI00344F83A5